MAREFARSGLNLAAFLMLLNSVFGAALIVLMRSSSSSDTSGTIMLTDTDAWRERPRPPEPDAQVSRDSSTLLLAALMLEA